MNLDESVEAIIDGIVTALKDEATYGGTLEEVETVVRGDRARPMPDMPAVWVVPQAARFAQDTFGGDEGWTMPVSIAALVKSNDPDTGGRQAQSIAARARAVALPVRPAGVAIWDTNSQTFDPTARSAERNRTIFWCEATISVLFTITE